MKKQMIVTSSDDVTVILQYVNKGEVYKEVCMSPGGSIGSSFFGSFFGWFWLIHLGSHRPSVLATLVPLKEWDYHHT